MKTNKEAFEELVEKCFRELNTASIEKYDAERAERTAAMFLAAQMQLAAFIEEIESRARHSKVDVERVEGEKYFEFKSGASGKITENTLTAMVAKDEAVLEAKRYSCGSEAELKKYNYLVNSLTNGHIFFRGIAKGKGWNE